MPDTKTGVSILDNMSALVSQYNSNAKILQVILCLADISLPSTGDPLGIALDLSQRGYEKATIDLIQAYFNLQMISSGTVMKTLQGTDVTINEQYFLREILPDLYVPDNRFVGAGFLSPTDLFPFKYKKIVLNYVWSEETPVLEPLPEGYMNHSLDSYGDYPSDACFGWFNPELESGGVLVAQQKFLRAYGEEEACNILIVPCEWLHLYTECDGLPEEYMGNGSVLDFMTLWRSTDPDYDASYPCFISRAEGMSLCETWEALSEDENCPFWGSNFEQRPQYHLRNAGIRHYLAYEGEYVIKLIAKSFVPVEPPIFEVFGSEVEPQTYVHLPPIMPVIEVLKHFPSSVVPLGGRFSQGWSENIDGSWYLSGNRKVLAV